MNGAEEEQLEFPDYRGTGSWSTKLSAYFYLSSLLFQ